MLVVNLSTTTRKKMMMSSKVITPETQTMTPPGLPQMYACQKLNYQQGANPRASHIEVSQVPYLL